MFRSILSKSLRDYRVPLLGWGLGLALLMFVGFATATPAVLATFANIAPLLSFLGDPYAMQTPEGYMTFRYLGAVVPLLLSIWLILAGARLVRGEEERSTLEVLLATPRSRARLLLEKVAGLLIASVLIAVLIALGAVAGEAVLGGQHVDLVRALLVGLNLSQFAFCFGMVALLVSQFTISRGTAAGVTGGLLGLSLILQITGREMSGSWLQYLSPFYYDDLNRPFIASFSNQPLAVLPLAGLCLLCLLTSLILFARRDIGRPAFLWQPTHGNGEHLVERSLSQAERAVSTRSVGLRTLCALGWSSFWWLLGIVAFSAYCVLLVPGIQKQFYQLVQHTPWLNQLFFDTPTNTNVAMLGTIAFSFLPALVILLALLLALSWSSDLEGGRLELVLSTPQARARIVLERFGANVLVVVLAVVLIWLALIIGARLINLNIDQGKVVAASFSMLPPALITLGLVYVLAGRLRHVAVLSVVTAYLTLSFLEETLEGLVSIPSWIGKISIFHLYGNPTFLGMDWGSVLGMSGVAVVLLIISLLQFRAVDIARG